MQAEKAQMLRKSATTGPFTFRVIDGWKALPPEGYKSKNKKTVSVITGCVGVRWK